MYVLKTKGSDKVADYVQIRNEKFELIDYIKLNFLHKKLIEYLGDKKAKEIENKLINVDYGEIIKVDK